jgi:hypothetical protein
MDLEGYGYEPHESLIERLLDDGRTLSPSGIERIAQGWEDHAGSGVHEAFVEAERAALHAIERNRRGSQWDEVRNRLRHLVEGEGSLISWRVEHGEVGHQAERAAFAAALALLARQDLSREQYLRLVRPMAEALPWLENVAGPTGDPDQPAES